MWILRPKICCHLFCYWSRRSKTWKSHTRARHTVTIGYIQKPTPKSQGWYGEKIPWLFQCNWKFHSQYHITVISQSPQWSVTNFLCWFNLAEPAWKRYLPKTIQGEILSKRHASHHGIEKTKLTAHISIREKSQQGHWRTDPDMQSLSRTPT